MGLAITFFLIAVFTTIWLGITFTSDDKLETFLMVGMLWLLSFGISILPAFIIGTHIDTGSGEYTGYVTGVEKAGVFFKTGTAYMKTDLTSSNEDAFCVIDDSVYTDLQAFSSSKSSVTIQYSSYLAPGIATCGGEAAFITSVTLK